MDFKNQIRIVRFQEYYLVTLALTIPQEYSFDSSLVDSIIDQAVAECEAKEVRGKAQFIY